MQKIRPLLAPKVKADKLGSTRSQPYRNAVARLDAAIARAERLGERH